MSAIHVVKYQANADRLAHYDRSHVKDLIRKLVSSSQDCSKDDSNPFRHIVREEHIVLIKPNWVLDKNFSGDSMDCMITHHEVVKAVVGLLVEAKPKGIIIADAPIQLCYFPNLIPAWLLDFFADLSAATGIPITIVDLRRTVAKTGDLSDGFIEDARPSNRYVEFNLRQNSFLERVTGLFPAFRITNYDPRKTAKSHSRGLHQYVIAKEIFEADIIISLPKLKTHRKAGITGALKNFVGINGNKECLAHHRIGGSFIGGDCYRGFSLSKLIAELLLDQANKNIGKSSYYIWKRWSDRFLRLARKLGEGTDLEGSWYGNDTVWRMVLDINRILFFGSTEGKLSNRPRANIYYLTDAIVVGEGEGPLAPTSKFLGYLTFSQTPLVDILHAKLMGYDWTKIPLLVNAVNLFSSANRFPDDLSSINVCFAGETIPLLSFPENNLDPALAPSGWKGHVEALKGNR
jgi:uncharacterized protein (DUF362 family)